MTRRILVVVHGYPPTARAGAEIHAWRTALGLHERGLEIRVLTFEQHAPGPITWADTIQEGISVRRLSGDVEWEQDPFQASYDNKAVARAMTDMVAQWRPDLVYFFSGYLMSSAVVRVAADFGIPVVINLTDYWWFCHQINLLVPSGGRCDGPTLGGCLRCHAERRRRWRLPGALLPRAATLFWNAAPRIPLLGNGLGAAAVQRRARVLSAALQRVSAFVAPSQFLAEFYQGQGLAPERFHVIRQGLGSGPRSDRTASSRLRVTFLGQLKAHKGVMTLLEAWSLLGGPKPRSLSLWGSAAGEEAFGERVRELTGRLPDVEWRGTFPPEEVWQVLASTDVLVIPSLWVENSPNVILEAQAMKIPVVGSDLGGIAELVQHDVNGLVFETGSARDLAVQLQRLLDEPGLLERLSRNARPVRTTAEEEEILLEVFRRLLPA
jgi:glycosyltransferase involved in cell wall biosynthesis